MHQISRHFLSYEKFRLLRNLIRIKIVYIANKNKVRSIFQAKPFANIYEKIPNEEANDGAHKIASEICEEKKSSHHYRMDGETEKYSTMHDVKQWV